VSYLLEKPRVQARPRLSRLPLLGRMAAMMSRESGCYYRKTRYFIGQVSAILLRRIVPGRPHKCSDMGEVTDMQNECFDPAEDSITIIRVDEATVHAAERRILSCEACNFDNAFLPFDNVFDVDTGNDPKVTDYKMSEPAHCPRCEGEVFVKTCVEWFPPALDLPRPAAKEDCFNKPCVRRFSQKVNRTGKPYAS